MHQPHYAGFWIRTAATLIDTVLLSLILIPILWFFYAGDWDRILATGLSSKPQIVWFDMLMNYIMPLLYTLLMWMLWSASLGKKILGLKIIDASSGAPLRFGQALLRYLGYFPAVIMMMIGIFWVIFDQRKQGWHDKMANTIVVHNR